MLQDVDVTCTGSQRPVFLLVNIMLVVVTTLVIESDVELLLGWTLKYFKDPTSQDDAKSKISALPKKAFDAGLDSVAAGMRFMIQLGASSIQVGAMTRISYFLIDTDMIIGISPV